MRAIASFHGAKNVHAGQVGTGERPVVHDFGNVRSHIGQHSGQMGQGAGAIREEHIKT